MIAVGSSGCSNPLHEGLASKQTEHALFRALGIRPIGGGTIRHVQATAERTLTRVAW